MHPRRGHFLLQSCGTFQRDGGLCRLLATAPLSSLCARLWSVLTLPQRVAFRALPSRCSVLSVRGVPPAFVRGDAPNRKDRGTLCRRNRQSALRAMSANAGSRFNQQDLVNNCGKNCQLFRQPTAAADATALIPPLFRLSARDDLPWERGYSLTTPVSRSTPPSPAAPFCASLRRGFPAARHSLEKCSA